MDLLDSKLLNIIQKGIPIVEKPFDIVAQELGVEPEEVIIRLKRLKEDGYIRRLGGLFSTAKMGYKSTLCAIEVPEEIFASVAELVNSYKQITHNYRRNHRLNMWFTLSTKTQEEKQAIFDKIKEKTGGNEVYEFPSKKVYKLNTFFNMESDAK